PRRALLFPPLAPRATGKGPPRRTSTAPRRWRGEGRGRGRRRGGGRGGGGRGRAGRAGRDGGARHAAARPLSSLEALRSLPSSTSALPDVAVGPEEAVCTDEHRVLPGVGGGGSRMRLLSPAPKSAIVFVL
ncbi:unnamed protein product, partial [Prorocentrum cordatum]